MPHIVLSDKIDLNALKKNFQVIIQKEPLIKLHDVFVNKDDFVALVPTLVRDKMHQEFFIEILTRDGKTTIRLYPQTDPQKTDSVKKSLGLLAEAIIQLNPSLEIARTNVGEFLPLSIKTK